jgi:DNA polymerase IV
MPDVRRPIRSALLTVPGRQDGRVRGEASILHLDLDAFYAAVEQRDKPSLRGKPVVVGGVGPRGVVATASYEARRFGVRSAMPTQEARRRCPHAAFLAPRFPAYREASEQVLGLLRTLSPVIEPLSLDEAYVDLRHSACRDFSVSALTTLTADLKEQVAATTGGLSASVGVGSSKFVAKVASELGKPNGLVVVAAGSEVELLGPLPVSVIPGVGPVTADRLRRLGVTHVADLHRWSHPYDSGPDDLAQVVGRAHARELVDLARGRDDRPVVAHREAKSISTEDTFETDLVDPRILRSVIDRHARAVAARLTAAGLLARTVTLKVRRHDFSTLTRAKSLLGPTSQPELISDLAQTLLGGVDTTSGVRLLGVGVSGLSDAVQQELFPVTGTAGDERETEGEGMFADQAADPQEDERSGRGEVPDRFVWLPGAEVRHDDFGSGWVWGSGLGRVTVRFESRHTPPGPVRTLWADDPSLHPL